MSLTLVRLYWHDIYIWIDFVVDLVKESKVCRRENGFVIKVWPREDNLVMEGVDTL